MKALSRTIIKIIAAVTTLLIIPMGAFAGPGVGRLTATFNPQEVGRILSGSTNVRVASFRLRAENEPIALSQITIKKQGSVRNADVMNTRLVDNNRNVPMGLTRAVVPQDGRLSYIFNPIVINPGSTLIFSVYADLAVQARGSLGFQIPESAAVQATGQNSAEAVRTTSAKWPVTNASREVALNAPVLSISNGINIRQPVGVGQANVLLGQFNVLSGATEDVLISSIRIRMRTGVGGGNLGHLLNVTAEVNGQRALVQALPDSYEFVISPNFTIRQGEQITLVLRGDIARHTPSGASFQPVIENATSISAFGTVTAINARFANPFPMLCPSLAVR